MFLYNLVLHSFIIATTYLKGIKFCEYLISQIKKKILWVFHFEIWSLQNISLVFSFALPGKTKSESLIENQFFYC